MGQDVETGLKNAISTRHWPLLIIIAAVAIRLILLIALPQQPFSDGAWYLDRARELASGMGYQEMGHATAFWPPGYPMLLAGGMMIFGPSLGVALGLNLAGAAIITWLIYWFGREVAGSRRAGLIAAALYAIYPAHIAYTGTPLSETTSTAMTMGALALLIAGRGRWYLILIAGLIFGATTLMRAQTLYFPIGVLIAMAFLYRDFSWVRAVKAGLILYLGMLAVVLPWSFRNQEQLGSFVLVSTNGGVALYTGAFDGATGDHVNWDKPMWDSTGIPFEQRVEREVEADEMLRGKATQWIKDNPGRYVSMMPKKAAFLWLKDSDGFWGLKGSYPELESPLTAAQWINQAFYALMLLLSVPCLIAGLVGWIKRDEGRRRLLMLFLMPVFVTLLAAFFTGQIRYHYGAMPFIIIAAGWTLDRLFQRVTKGRALPS